MEINSKIGKILGIVFILFVFWFVYNYLTKSAVEDTSNEAVIRARASDLTKVISIAQIDSSDYGTTNKNLPYVGCSLPGTYLDNPNVKRALEDFAKTEVTCVSGGQGGILTKWAISIKISDNKYWCVDEDGNRELLKQKVAKASCK